MFSKYIYRNLISYFRFQGKVALVSAYGIHQLHIFIFVLAVFHVLYCIITYALGKTKVHDLLYTFCTSLCIYLYVFNLFFNLYMVMQYVDEEMEVMGERDQNN